MILARLAALLVLASPIACAGRTVMVDGRAVPYEEARADSFGRAREAQAAGRYDGAAKLYERFLAEFPEGDLADEARLRRGQSLARAARNEEAAAVLEELLEKHPTSRFKGPAAIELNLVQSRLGQKGKAEALTPVVAAMSEQEKQQAAGALSEAFAQSGQHGESVRWGAKALEAAEPGPARDALKLEFAERLRSAPPAELAKLVAELDPRSPAFGPAALRLARLQLHTGDRLHAQELLGQLAASQPPGPEVDAARELSLRLQSTAAVKPTLVGVVLPLTGDLKPFADSTLDAIALRLDPAGKGAITLVVRDSKNDADGAARAVEELAREGVIAILGPIGLQEGPGAAVRAQQLGVPMISLSRAEGITAFGPWIFRNMLTNSAQAKAVAEYAQKKLNAKTFGVLQPDSPYGDEMTRYFWDAVDEGGGEVRAFERYPRQTTTFKPFVARMVGRANLEERAEYLEEEKKILAEITDPYRRRKALQALKGGAAPIVDFDALFIPDNAKTVRLIAPAIASEDVITAGCDEKELAVVKKTTKREDLRTVQLLGTNLWDNPELVDERAGAGRYVQCSIFADTFFPASQRPATRQFVDEFDAAYHRQPGFLEAHGHDAAGLVKELIEKKKPTSREQLRDLLAAMDKPFVGASGDLKFGPDREVKKQLFWLWITRGNIQEFDPEGTPPVPPAQPPPPPPAAPAPAPK